MIQAPKARTSVIVGVLLLAAYGIVGLPKSVDELKANLKNNIRLGLDLKGGSFLVLEVQVQDAMKAEADRTMESLKEDLRKNGIDYVGMERNDPSTVKEADSIQINIKGVSPSKVSDLRNLINTSRYASWFLTGVSPTEYRLNMKPTDLIALKKDTLDQTKQTIEHRINGLGVGETTIQERRRADAEFELVVELPGVDDPARVKGIMQTAAMLELCAVKGGPYASRDDALAKNGGVLPLDSKLVRGSARGEEGGDVWYLLGRTAVVTGRDLRNARPSRGEMGRWETDFVLGKDGARRFARFTESNIGNKLAIVLDNQVRSAPTIQNRIEDSGRITGAANEQDASDLALVLREGSLPAGIQYPEERTVGPSLGADSIRQGLMAGIVGLGLVILAMLIYYKGAGVNAVLALFLNTIILLAVLSYVGAVLTLPGIAGVILTIGMAVDSNVLIFERIREELRAGNGVVPAVAAGFNKAFRTIVDTHVTTVVSCAFLFLFGEGPVKGFAVTLTIGLIANVFTAVFVSKTIFQYELSGHRRMEALSI